MKEAQHQGIDEINVDDIRVSPLKRDGMPMFYRRKHGINRRHVAALRRDFAYQLKIGNQALLKPLVVLRVDGIEDGVLVIDGHHRLEAIRKHNASRTSRGIIRSVSCEVWSGGLNEGVEVSYRVNREVVLPLSHRARADIAWQALWSPHTDVYRNMGDRVLEKLLLVSRTTINRMRGKFLEFSMLDPNDEAITREQHMASAVTQLEDIGAVAYAWNVMRTTSPSDEFTETNAVYSYRKKAERDFQRQVDAGVSISELKGELAYHDHIAALFRGDAEVGDDLLGEV